MKLGFFTAPYAAQPLKETIKTLRKKYKPDVLQGLELGTGNYPPDGHCKPAEYLGNKDRQHDLKAMLSDGGFEISALSCHGNPLHPRRRAIGIPHSKVYDQTIQLANELEVPVVVAFSGLSGDGESRTPIWVTNPWPDEHYDLWEKQLGEQAQYWDKVTRQAKIAGIDIAIELHPMMFMHNVATYRAVKKEVKKLQTENDGSVAYLRLKVNPDISHDVWRGMDPVAVIRELGSDIAYVHAKDALINKQEVAVNGNIDQRPFSDPANRAWSFVYCGSGEVNWGDVVRELRRVGYDGYLSIEHEDGEMDAAESLDMAINHLHALLPRKVPGPMTWADR